MYSPNHNLVYLEQIRFHQKRTNRYQICKKEFPIIPLHQICKWVNTIFLVEQCRSQIKWQSINTTNLLISNHMSFSQTNKCKEKDLKVKPNWFHKSILSSSLKRWLIFHKTTTTISSRHHQQLPCLLKCIRAKINRAVNLLWEINQKIQTDKWKMIVSIKLLKFKIFKSRLKCNNLKWVKDQWIMQIKVILTEAEMVLEDRSIKPILMSNIFSNHSKCNSKMKAENNIHQSQGKHQIQIKRQVSPQTKATKTDQEIPQMVGLAIVTLVGN